MNTPKIRFKGFKDDWEQRKFGDYNDLMTGYPFESDKFSEDGIKLVRGMNVKRGYLDFSGDICVKWNSCVGLENFLLKDGDILIQMDGALIGKSYAKIKENQLPALLVQRVTRARTNNKFASQDFMYQTIQRDFLRYIEMNKTETAVPHLSLNDIRNFEIMVPCLAEQKKIGEYFDSLDNLITLHQRKCNETKQLKKFMLQKMFPKNGEKNPEIRFEGFTDDWEQRKLGELGTVQTCKRIFKEQTSEKGDIPFFKNGTIGLEPDSYISREMYEEFRRLYPYPEVGDTLISVVGSIGRTAEYTGKDEYFQDSNVVWLKTDGSINKKFLKISYQVIKWLIEGSTVKHLYNDNILRSEIVMPVSQIEQAKIAEFFEELDHLITLHQRKCEKLKELKKYMLQNMFV